MYDVSGARLSAPDRGVGELTRLVSSSPVDDDGPPAPRRLVKPAVDAIDVENSSLLLVTEKVKETR